MEQTIEPWTSGFRVWIDVPSDYGLHVASGWQLGTVVEREEGWVSRENCIFVRLDRGDAVFCIDMSDPDKISRLKPVVLLDTLEMELVPQMPNTPEQAMTSPYAGSTVAPSSAGVQTQHRDTGAEHRPDGMLNGALVHIRYADAHGRYMVTGTIKYWGSVPSAHALVLVKPREQDGEWERKIIMAHAITEVDPAGET